MKKNHGDWEKWLDQGKYKISLAVPESRKFSKKL